MQGKSKDRLHSVSTFIRSGIHSEVGHADEAAPPIPSFTFVTISRQAGAGGKSLAYHLAEALNADATDATRWQAWDRELTERVAGELGVRRELVDAMENCEHRWFGDVLSSLAPGTDPDEFKIYRRTAVTIRGLASAGHAIIVGRGGVFATAGLSGGLHVRLVAPVDHRIEKMAERLGRSRDEAAVKVCEIDRNRNAFYRRYWPNSTLAPETFTLTLNTRQMTEAQMVAGLLALLSFTRPAPPKRPPMATPDVMRRLSE